MRAAEIRFRWRLLLRLMRPATRLSTRASDNLSSGVILLIRASLVLTGFCPKLLRNRQRIYSKIIPPLHFGSGCVNGAMVASTEGHRELIADLPSKSPRPRES